MFFSEQFSARIWNWFGGPANSTLSSALITAAYFIFFLLHQNWATSCCLGVKSSLVICCPLQAKVLPAKVSAAADALETDSKKPCHLLLLPAYALATSQTRQGWIPNKEGTHGG